MSEAFEHASIYRSNNLSTYFLFLHSPINLVLSIYLFIHLYICIDSVHLFIYLFIYFN